MTRRILANLSTSISYFDAAIFAAANLLVIGSERPSTLS
jgi:hypothetical protein